MKNTAPVNLCVILMSLLLAGCASTPQDRISGHRSTFEKFPAEVQQKVIAGEVDVGFTEEMVLMALGKPGRKFERSDAGGVSEVWVYYKRKPQFGFGLGVSSGGYGGVSTGVSMSTSPRDDDEFMRVDFQGGRVVAVEKSSGG